jgi:hypothetical protein
VGSAGDVEQKQDVSIIAKITDRNLIFAIACPVLNNIKKYYTILLMLCKNEKLPEKW